MCIKVMRRSEVAITGCAIKVHRRLAVMFPQPILILEHPTTSAAVPVAILIVPFKLVVVLKVLVAVLAVDHLGLE